MGWGAVVVVCARVWVAACYRSVWWVGGWGRGRSHDIQKHCLAQPGKVCNHARVSQGRTATALEAPQRESAPGVHQPPARPRCVVRPSSSSAVGLCSQHAGKEPRRQGDRGALFTCVAPVQHVVVQLYHHQRWVGHNAAQLGGVEGDVRFALRRVLARVQRFDGLRRGGAEGEGQAGC